MPTAYTQTISEGITFSQFVLRCARAFGACVDMRDEPLDVPIPEKFEPNSYYSDELAKLRAEHARIEALSKDECRALNLKEHEEEKERRTLFIQEQKETLKKYNAMLSQVEAWRPPTSDHYELKNFMIKQINQSIKYDCDIDWHLAQWEKEPLPEIYDDPNTWKYNKLNEIKKEIQRVLDRRKEEYHRLDTNNKWINELRISLPKETDPKSEPVS